MKSNARNVDGSHGTLMEIYVMYSITIPDHNEIKKEIRHKLNTTYCYLHLLLLKIYFFSNYLIVCVCMWCLKAI